MSRRADDAYGALLLEASRSQAYQKFCIQALGCNVGQLSPVDRSQLRMVRQLVRRHAQSWSGDPYRVLDLGCGTGGIAYHLSNRLDLDVLGIDFARAAIDAAKNRWLDGDGPRFRVDDLLTLDLGDETFATLLAIDVLANLSAPRLALNRWLPHLAPGGQLLLLGSAEDPRPAHALPLVRWLRRQDYRVQHVDLTAFEHRHWPVQLATLDALRRDFAAEGHLALFALLRNEAIRGQKLVRAGRARRFLLRATPLV